MNRPKGGRPLACSDPLMDVIAHLRHAMGRGLRSTEWAVDKMHGEGAKGPDRAAARRRAPRPSYTHSTPG